MSSSSSSTGHSGSKDRYWTDTGKWQQQGHQQMNSSGGRGGRGGRYSSTGSSYRSDSSSSSRGADSIGAGGVRRGPEITPGAGQMTTSDIRSNFYLWLKRLTRGNLRRPGDVCWLTQYAWALLNAEVGLVVLEAFGSSNSSCRSSSAAGPASSISGLELLRELICSTSGADCKLVLDSPTAAAAGISFNQPSNLLPFQACLLPVMRLLSDPRIQNSPSKQYTNTIYAALFQDLDHGRCADMIRQLLTTLTEAPATSTASSSSSQAAATDDSAGFDAAAANDMAGPAAVWAGPQGCWATTGWLDVLEPFVSYLLEVLRRFRQDDSWQRRKEGVLQLVAVVQDHWKRFKAAAGAAGHGSKARRLQSKLEQLEGVLGQRVTRDAALSTLQQRTRRAAAAVTAASARTVRPVLPEQLPGELRQPGGPRHDNDHAHFRDISIAPTQQQVLCDIQPYLPRNKPGGALVAEGISATDAHLDLHFRLTHHDLLADLIDSVGSMKDEGGIAGLDARKAQSRGSRVNFSSNSSLNVYRRINIEQLCAQPRTGIFFEVSFAEPPGLQSLPTRDKLDFWKNSKQLEHGSLIALWHEPNAPSAQLAARRARLGVAAAAAATVGSLGGDAAAAVEPHIIFATVVNRDARKLAGIQVADSSSSGSGSEGGGSKVEVGRCYLGISLCHASHDNELLVQACLGRGQFSGAGEVVLLQASNSFSSQEPILKALQQMTVLPMAQYLVPDLVGTGGIASIPVPAYMADQEARLDLSSICDTALAARHGNGQELLRRLSNVPVSELATFPLRPLLLACTSLDGAQADALIAGLTQEWALIQGPPGTGKTYVGILLVKALLANTCNAQSTAAPADPRTNRQPPPPPPPPPPAAAAAAPHRKPDTGPILMVTVTNHAIDSLMEGLLDAGVAARPGQMIRVGGRSKSERLQPYNLRELTGPAGGRNISALLQASKEAEGGIRAKVQQLKRAKEHKLYYEDVRSLLQLDAPELLSSFNKRYSWLQTLNESGWQVAGSSKSRASKAAAAGDVLGHWLASDPEGDWRLQREVEVAEEALRLAQQQAEMGLEGWDDYAQMFGGAGYGMQGHWGVNHLSAVPVVTANAFAALGDTAAAAGSEQLSALTRLPFPQAMPSASGYNWQQQQLMHPFMAHPGPAITAAAAAAAAAAPAVQAAERVPAAVAAACQQQRGINQLLFDETDACMMSRAERQTLLQYLKEQLVGGFADALHRDIAALERANTQLRQLYESRDLQTLRRARVVGMTTTSVARMQNLVAALQPKVLVIEEAGELLEAHTLASLSAATEHVILIGDHEQLRPKAQYYHLEAASGRGYDLDVSAFERLASSGSIPVVTLQEQRRMRPDISRLIRAPIYPSLRDHPSVAAYPPVRGVSKPLFMLAHSVPEGGQGGDDGRSKFNMHEVDLAVGLASYLIKQGYNKEGDLVILTPYVGQLRRLTKAVAGSNMRVVLSEKDTEELAKLEDDATAVAAAADGAGTASSSGSGIGAVAAGVATAGSGKVTDMQSCLRLATIDNFQGEEATVVILSLVRSRPDGNIGFLRLRNRINVLLSRAKHGMYLLGNADTLRAAAALPPEGSRRPAAPMWGQVLDMLEETGCIGRELELVCQKHGNVTRVCQPDDFELLAGDGGCQLPCDERLPCGHACHRRCHADDPGHITSRCLQPCAKLCAAGLHACSKLCYQECGSCAERVDGVSLPCGHAADGVPCYQTLDLSLICCHAQVTVRLPCGHSHTTSCSAAAHLAANPHTCPAAVQLTLPACGHTLSCPCSEVLAKRLDPRACKEPCGALLPGCLHGCTSSCGGCMGLSLEQMMRLWVQALEAQQGSEWEGLAALCRQHMAHAGGVLQLLRFLQAADTEATAGGRRSSSQTGSTAVAAHLVAQRTKLANSWLAWLQQLQSTAPGPAATSSTTQQQLHLPANFTLSHPACKLKCDKPLSCGHPCSSSCHSSKPCPPCSCKCPIACEHTRCGKGCNAPCAPCAEPCGWSCSHQGACSLPCSAPCDRLPCNERCEKKLKCGHRCPGLCGEACLQGCCVHPKCKDKVAKAKPHLMEQVVDVIMQSTFAEVDGSAVDSDPLLLLPCGHVFCTSSLDGWMNLSEAYEGTASGEDSLTTWASPKALPADVWSPKSCPAGGCAGLVVGLRRYGRPANKALLDLIQRKQLEAGRLRCQQLPGQLKSLAAEVDSASKAPSLKQGFALLKRCNKMAQDLQAGLAQQQSPPTARVHEGCMVALKRLQAQQQLTAEQVEARQQLLLVPQPDTSLCGRFARGIAQVTEQRLRVVQLLLAAAMLDTDTAGGVVADDYMTRFGDRGRGRGQAAVGGSRAQSATKDRQVVTLLVDSTARLQQVSALLQQQTADAAATSSYRAARKIRLAHMMLAVQRVMQLQSLKPTRVAALLQRALHRTTAHESAALDNELAGNTNEAAAAAFATGLAKVLGTQPGQGPLGPDRSAEGQAGTSGWQHGSAGNAAAACAAGGAAWADAVLQLQQEILLQVQHLGRAALMEIAATAIARNGSSTSSSMGAAAAAVPSSSGSDAAASIRELLQQLPQVLESVTRDAAAAEMAEVLQAMHKAEFGHEDVESFMRGRLYQCPNGHMYVIGECGRAMQRSTCPECGSTVGGTSHHLESSNSRADGGILQRLREAVRPGRS